MRLQSWYYLRSANSQKVGDSSLKLVRHESSTLSHELNPLKYNKTVNEIKKKDK